MKKYPSIAVIMVNFNGLQYLKKTIPLVLDFEYPNFEFHIVDNGSSDGSVEYIKSFPKINLIISPVYKSKNFACNYAVKNTQSDYILMLDNDAMIEDKHILKNLVENFTQLDKAGSLMLAFYLNESDTKTSKYGGFLGYNFLKRRPPLKESLVKKMHNQQVAFPIGFAFFIKRSIWNKVGGYDEHLIFGGDDNDLGIKIMLKGYKNYLYSKSLQKHIGMPERKDNKKYADKHKNMLYSQLYTIVKNYSFFNMILALLIYSTFSLLKSIKQSIFRLSIGPFISFWKGYYLFLKHLPICIKKRKKTQSGRVVQEDIFLKINPTRV
jgi:GT2 family glycosyltransferase